MELEKYCIKTILIFLILNIILDTSCVNKESSTQEDSNIMSISERSKCLENINQKMVEITNDPILLMSILEIDSNEANIISIGNPSELETNALEKLIQKLSTQTVDSTLIPFDCGFPDGATFAKGDIAFIAVYKLEPFPFALALGEQWCTGGPMSDSIYLPNNFIDYSSFDGRRVSSRFLEYIDSEERKDYKNRIN